MFLPVLLVRDYGVWGWVVFAVPNVIGAAAMGWVLRDWMRSVRIMAAHAHACIAFTLVTVAFQVYFLEWWVRPLGGWTYASVALAVLVALVLAVPTWGSLWAGWATFAFSTVVAALFLSSHPPSPPAVTTHAAWPDLLFLAPVSALGFLLCPYLDLTFHEARFMTLSRGAARAAFTVGFGVFFLAMILFTLGYAGFAVSPEPGRLATLVALHMSVQLAFTVLVHFLALRVHPPPPVLHHRVLAAIAAGATGAVLGALVHRLPAYHGISAGEIGYRLFMACYGLIFPAYVWLCMLGSPAESPSRRGWIVLAVTVVLASPLYWLGFIEQRTIWLVPGIAIVLLAKLASGQNSGRRAAEVAA